MYTAEGNQIDRFFQHLLQPAKKIISDVQQASTMIKDLEITNLREVLGIANQITDQQAADQNNGKESSAEHLGKCELRDSMLLYFSSNTFSTYCTSFCLKVLR